MYLGSVEDHFMDQIFATPGFHCATVGLDWLGVHPGGQSELTVVAHHGTHKDCGLRRNQHSSSTGGMVQLLNTLCGSRVRDWLPL